MWAAQSAAAKPLHWNERHVAKPSKVRLQTQLRPAQRRRCAQPLHPARRALQPPAALPEAQEAAEKNAEQQFAAQQSPPPPPPPPAASQPQSGQPEPPHQQPTQQRSAVTGLVYLLSVALLWGSYTPALR